MSAQLFRIEETGHPLGAPGENLSPAVTAPREIIQWAFARAQAPVISTNFRPHSAVLLHLVTQVRPEIPVIWVDSGYNTPATYRFAAVLNAQLRLNLQVYTPRVSAARRLAVMGGVPGLDESSHERFTQEVKLEPFERAFRELQPDLWFTGIRADQTAFRKSLGVVSNGVLGSLKIAPLYHWTEVDLENYLYEFGLPDNLDYADPTKVLDDRECGLQHLGSGI